MSKHKISAPGRARAGRGEYGARIKISPNHWKRGTSVFEKPPSGKS
jgi:hypothetical protein